MLISKKNAYPSGGPYYMFFFEKNTSLGNPNLK
jgi:hypothetical protein